MPGPVIDDARVAPGHDGEAVLVVQVRHENGGVDSVTLDADCARRLLENCDAQVASDLRGKPWQHLLDVLPR